MDFTLTKLPLLSFLAGATLITPHALAWSPGVGNESSLSGFKVNTQSRNDVISFWNSVYAQSLGYEQRLGWTGSFDSSDPGITSTALKNDVLRRVNFYRAMAGMNADIEMNSGSNAVDGSSGPNAPLGTSKESAAQAAAFMLSANSSEFLSGGGVTNGSADPHNPPESWIEDNDTARNGAYYSNVAIGHFGPGAIDAYISEDAQGAGGAENSDVGHRRHILHSRLQEIATGDVSPIDSGYLPANALYVFGNLLPATSSPRFTSWPNPGFIPEPLVPRLWSLSYPGADFSNASVTMNLTDGNTITSVITSDNASYADNTIVWKSIDSSSIPSAEYEDVTIHVTVSNILVAGVTTSHDYEVTIINPGRLTQYPELAGTTTPLITGASYVFNQIDHAEAYQFEVSSLSPVTWEEGAENSTSDYVMDDTSPNYKLRDHFQWGDNGSEFWKTGYKAFHLAFPNNNYPFTREIFTLKRTIAPGAGASMAFNLRRGYMTPETQLEVQYSADGGGSWMTIETFIGNSDYSPDNQFNLETIELPVTQDPITIRFLLHRPASSTGVFNVTDHPQAPIGVYIDDINFLNCEWFDVISLTSVTKGSNLVTLNSESAGGTLEAGTSYTLRVRPKVGTLWLPYGKALTVTPVDSSNPENYREWAQTHYPLIGEFDQDYDADGLPNGVEYLLGLSPMNGTDSNAALTPVIQNGKLEISHPVITDMGIGAEYSYSLEDGSWTPIAVTISTDGLATASVDLSGSKGMCFIRWKATEL